MKTSMQEKRKSPRIIFTSRIRIRTEDADMEATADSRDISVSGIYVHTANILPIGTMCSLSIDLSGDTSEMHLEVAGIVRRHDATGMGIAFPDLTVDSFVHLKNLVQLHLALSDQEE